MANYKSIIDVESVEQATEAMNVLVEDGGSLKKVPAGGMIGGSGGGKKLVISYKKSAVAPMSLQENPTEEYVSNMSFDDFCSLISSGEFEGGLYYEYFDDFSEFEFLCLNQIMQTSDYLTLVFSGPYDRNIILAFYPNGQIIESSVDS